MENRISKWIGSDQHTSDQIMEEISEILDARDSKALKEMFSKEAIAEATNLDSQIQQLMDYYQGTMKSYDGNARSSSHTKYGIDLEQEFGGSYKVETDLKTYQVFYECKTIDEENPDKVGLSVLELVTEEVYQKEVDRRGSYKWQFPDKGVGVYIKE